MKVVLAVVLLAFSAGAYAAEFDSLSGVKTGQLKAASSGKSVSIAPVAVEQEADAGADVDPADGAILKSSCHKHHNNMPGCPGFCNTHPMHVSCRPPAYCGTNPNGYGCPKSLEADVDAYAADDGYDKGICHRHHNNFPGCPGFCNQHPSHNSCRPPAYCGTNPNGFGCNKSLEAGAEDPAAAGDDAQKSICHKHHNNFPGCPGYCNAHPMHVSCRPPAYCHTNPNGYNCPKSVDADIKAVAEDADVADSSYDKGICHRRHNNFPGCPGFCNQHPSHASCRPPAYCHTNPNGYGCPKSLDENKGLDEEKGLDTATSEDEAKSICSHHHMRPGCPEYCQLNPLSAACGHKPAYCGTNPNGYGCK